MIGRLCFSLRDMQVPLAPRDRDWDWERIHFRIVCCQTGWLAQGKIRGSSLSRRRRTVYYAPSDKSQS